MTLIVSHAATRGTCTTAAADSFCSTDARAFKQRAQLSVSSDAGTSQLSQAAGPGDTNQSLPFPLHFKLDGELEIHYLLVYMMTIKAMRQQCLQLNLPSSGTKAILSCSQVISSSSLRPGAHKAHKGPWTGPASKAKARRMKQSTQHHAELLGDFEMASDTTATTCSKDTHMMAEVAALLPWADAINHAFPYALTDGQLAPAVSTLPCPTPAIAGADVGLPEAGPQDVGTSTGCTPEEPAPAMEMSTKRMRVLKLGNGTLLQVADNEIPDPPAISFVNDIPRLNGIWDNHTEHWQDMSIINIQGHPIAIEYWPLLYHYGHDQQWKGMKNKWTDWRDIVEWYRQGTPEQFWARFRAANGEPLKFTAIIHRLCKERKDAHFALVERACEEYGSDFFFTY
ncbi:hypothetical protein EV424DRAFT_1348246 [Suillus variegatus]|nr:hypothetical protein EV424DRAFT_1348246 [Suillus variegatus]